MAKERFVPVAERKLGEEVKTTKQEQKAQEFIQNYKDAQKQDDESTAESEEEEAPADAGAGTAAEAKPKTLFEGDTYRILEGGVVEQKTAPAGTAAAETITVARGPNVTHEQWETFKADVRKRGLEFRTEVMR